MPTLLSIGCGYSAVAFAQRLLSQGWQVIGTTRTYEKADRLKAMGIQPLIWPGEDLTQPIKTATHLLISAAPDDAGDPVLRALSDQLCKANHLTWVAYLSTTGVYGDHASNWVDETTPLTTTTKRGLARIQAETAWRHLANKAGLPLHIFRLGGIYGPGRGPFSKVRSGSARRIVKPGQVFSRIHVEDIAQTLEASAYSPNPGAVYNICDDEPAPPEDVIEYAARLLGLPAPPVESWENADLSPMARSFYAESKRVKNARIKGELGVRLLYPNYRVGLSALIEKEAIPAGMQSSTSTD